jgi:hypothetical protein
VCEQDRTRTQILVRLRPKVRKPCFGLLGPAPEDEDWFYRHPDETPKPRPARKRSPVLSAPDESAGSSPPAKPRRGGRARKRTVDQPVSEAVAGGATADGAAGRPPEPPPPPKVYPEAEESGAVAQLTDEGLAASHREAKECCGRYSKRSPIGQLVCEALAELKAEFRRRGWIRMPVGGPGPLRFARRDPFLSDSPGAGTE